MKSRLSGMISKKNVSSLSTTTTATTTSSSSLSPESSFKEKKETTKVMCTISEDDGDGTFENVDFIHGLANGFCSRENRELICEASHTRIYMVHDKVRRGIHVHASIYLDAYTRSEMKNAEKERDVLLDLILRTCGDCVIFMESTHGTLPRPNASLLLLLSNSPALMSSSRRIRLGFVFMDVDASGEDLCTIETSMENQISAILGNKDRFVCIIPEKCGDDDLRSTIENVFLSCRLVDPRLWCSKMMLDARSLFGMI